MSFKNEPINSVEHARREIKEEELELQMERSFHTLREILVRNGCVSYVDPRGNQDTLYFSNIVGDIWNDEFDRALHAQWRAEDQGANSEIDRKRMQKLIDAAIDDEIRKAVKIEYGVK